MNCSLLDTISALAPRVRLPLMIRHVLAIASICSLTAIEGRAQVAPSRPAQRPLAPGVLTTIAPGFEPEETVSTHDLIEVRANTALEWKPEYLAASDTLYGKAAGVKF